MIDVRCRLKGKENWAASVAVATQPGIIATIYLSPIACDAHLCGRALLKKLKTPFILTAIAAFGIKLKRRKGLAVLCVVFPKKSDNTGEFKHLKIIRMTF